LLEVWRGLRAPFAFALAWALVNAMLNLRYPGPDPAFWYLLASTDAVLIFCGLGVFGAYDRRAPKGVLIALVAFLFLVRVVRLGDGISERYFDQRFSLYTDLPLAADLARYSHSSLGSAAFYSLSVAVIAVLSVLCAVTYRALAFSARFLTKPRGFVILGGLAAISFVCGLALRSDPANRNFLFGGFAASVLPRLKRELVAIGNLSTERAQRITAIEQVQEEWSRTPSNLAKLRGASVQLFFVESYGQTVVERPEFQRVIRPIFDAFESELGKNGFHLASSILDAPTYGGRSWLAHATLWTGVRTADQLQFDLVCAAKPKSIASFFKAAGYRTVLVQPGTTRPWLKGQFYPFDKAYYAWDFDYVGPAFAWATMPDQYVLDFVRRRELDPAPGPVFIHYVLVSSHAPWSELPVVVDDWAQIDNGALYAQREPIRFPVVWPNFENASEAYIRAIEYDMAVLRRYIAEFVRDGSLVIILGDHQPVVEVTGHSPSAGVPIHVLSRDKRFVETFMARGYERGMWPRTEGPHPGMETFLASFLGDFSTSHASN
jgi:hypothetical protein